MIRLPLLRLLPRRALAALALVALLVFAPGVQADEPYWVDVRSPGEYAGDHLSLAVNIPYTEITQRIDEVTTDKDARIYLYCRSGRRSDIARQALEQAGYTDVVNAGGLEEARHTAARLETCASDPAADC